MKKKHINGIFIHINISLAAQLASRCGARFGLYGPKIYLNNWKTSNPNLFKIKLKIHGGRTEDKFKNLFYNCL